jgi:hypothetical protein
MPSNEKIKARHDLIVMQMDIVRTAILGAIERLHPGAADCLPLPDLELPELAAPAPAEAGGTAPLPDTRLKDPYDTITDAIYRNLFTPEGDRSMRWRADHPDACPHLPHSSVIAVYELIHKWYGLFDGARRFRDAESKRHILDWKLGFVQFHLNELARLPAAPVQVAPVQVVPPQVAPSTVSPRADMPPAAAELLIAVGQDAEETAACLPMEGTFTPDQVMYGAYVLLTQTLTGGLSNARAGRCPDCGEDYEPDVVEDAPGDAPGLRLWSTANHLMVDGMVALGCGGTEAFPRGELITTPPAADTETD